MIRAPGMPAVDPTARVHESVRLGPGALVGAHAIVGPGCVLEAYAVVGPHTTLGAECHVHPFVVVGGPAQDRRTAPDAPYRLVCGDGCTFREGVTVSRGTGHGAGETRLGHRVLLMAHSHVGHDCAVGDDVTLANGVSLAGHVEIGAAATLGGHAAVHQFARVGELAFVAANAMVSLDVPPFCLAAGDRARLYGLNVTGLRRAGLPADVRRALHAAFRRMFGGGGVPRAAAEALVGHSVEQVARLAAFVLESPRGVCRRAGPGRSLTPADTDD